MEWRAYYTLSTKNIIVTAVKVFTTHIYIHIYVSYYLRVSLHIAELFENIYNFIYDTRHWLDFDPLSRFVFIIIDTIVDTGKIIAYFRRLLSFYFSRINIFINVEPMFFTLSSSRQCIRSTLLLLFLFNDSVLVASRPFNCVYAYHLMHRSIRRFSRLRGNINATNNFFGEEEDVIVEILFYFIFFFRCRESLRMIINRKIKWKRFEDCPCYVMFHIILHKYKYYNI